MSEAPRPLEHGDAPPAFDAEDLRTYLEQRAREYASDVNYEAADAVRRVLDELFPASVDPEI